jgi:hypothetical protein
MIIMRINRVRSTILNKKRLRIDFRNADIEFSPEELQSLIQALRPLDNQFEFIIEVKMKI